jgi:hypothetical protein
VTLEDNQTYDRGFMGGSGAYILIGKIQAAHAYSERLGNRVKAAHQSKRAKARTEKATSKLVTVPWIKEGKLLEPFAGLVRKAVELYLKGKGHRAICIELQPLIEADPELKARYEKPLHASTVKRWLRSPALVGDWQSADGLIEGLFEPLLSEVEYQQVQNLLSERKARPTKETKYLLSGLIKCSKCGGSFHTRTQYPHPTKDAPKGSEAYAAKAPILYCNCSNYLKNGSCSNKTTWPYQVLHFILMSGLPSRLHELEKSKPLASGDAEQLKSEIAELKAKQERYRDVYIDSNDLKYRDLANSLNEPIAALTAQLVIERQTDVAMLDLGILSEGVRSFIEQDELAQNQMLKRLEHSVQVQGSRAWRTHAPDQVFELVRRSQKHAAYVVKRTRTKADGVVDLRFFAVDAKGRTSFSSKYKTEQALMDALKVSPSDPEKFYFFKSLAETVGAG